MRFLLAATAVLVALVALATPVQAGIDGIARPGEREFVRDKAQIITARDELRIRRICDALLTDKATPIIVVTIDRMADHADFMTAVDIEVFASLLFKQWQIGLRKLNGQDWNTGILLLVSAGDRKARIELGAGWGREQDALCRTIMDDHIIRRFKQGDYSGGVLAGVVALDAMARHRALPPAPKPWWFWPVTLLLIGLAAFTIVSLIRRGSGGWAWLFWAAVFTLIGTLLYWYISSLGRGRGGYGGGSFGGGFSGGGGATGSW